MRNAKEKRIKGRRKELKRLKMRFRGIKNE